MSVFREVVAANHRDSDAVLFAFGEPCISIAHDERRNVSGRSFRLAGPDALAGLRLRPSWIVAALLCPGDDTRALTAWVRDGRREPTRVLFYLHPGTDARSALAAWHEAGLPVHSAWTVRSWKELHRHFGAAWNVRVFEDFRSGHGPG